jgi:hypothetical protein
MSTRAYGSGSIVQEGPSWYGKWRVGDRQVKRRLGRVRPVGTSDGITRKQAEAELRRLMSEVKVLAPEERITFRTAAERYVHHVEHVMGSQALDRAGLPHHDRAPPRAALQHHGDRQDQAR